MRELLFLLRAHHVFVRHGLDQLLLVPPWLRPLRWLVPLSPWFWFSWHSRRQARGVRLRRALEELGPLFVKFGQSLSTRADLLPVDIAEELSLLQDRVRPFPGRLARLAVERSLGQPVTELFAAFDEQPLASASVAQVHAARLQNGSEVVVKILRPDIERQVAINMAILYRLAHWLQALFPETRRLRLVEVVGEFDRVLHRELDLLQEAASASQLRRNFAGRSDLYVPEVHWDQTRADILVIERIDAIPIDDLETLNACGHDRKKLAERGVQIFFHQVFNDNFFHADMHPGNIFVRRQNPTDPSYVCVDFGIVGSLTEEDQDYLAENFVAFFNRDYRRVAELHLLSGWVPEDTRIDDFEHAIRAVCEPIFKKPLADVSFGALLLRLFQTARYFRMEVQPQLMLLQKTLMNIEGIGRVLYPQLDLWGTAKPEIENWLAQKRGPAGLAKQLWRRWPSLSRQLPALPDRAMTLMRKLENEVDAARHERTRRLDQERQTYRRRRRCLLLAAAAVAAFLGVHYPLNPWSWGLLGVAVLCLWPDKPAARGRS